MVPNSATVREEHLREKALIQKQKEMAALKKEMVGNFNVQFSYVCLFTDGLAYACFL